MEGYLQVAGEQLVAHELLAGEAFSSNRLGLDTPIPLFSV